MYGANIAGSDFWCGRAGALVLLVVAVQAATESAGGGAEPLPFTVVEEADRAAPGVARDARGVCEARSPPLQDAPAGEVRWRLLMIGCCVPLPGAAW
jgi:hypothetical protein